MTSIGFAALHLAQALFSAHTEHLKPYALHSSDLGQKSAQLPHVLSLVITGSFLRDCAALHDRSERLILIRASDKLEPEHIIHVVNLR